MGTDGKTSLGTDAVPVEHRYRYRKRHCSASRILVHTNCAASAMQRLVPPTDMKAEEVDEATPKMLTRISKWQKRMKLSTPY